MYTENAKAPYLEPVNCCASEPSLTELQKEVGAISADVLSMSKRIKTHLFGPVPDKSEGTANSPQCFRDELIEQCSHLRAAADTLSVICNVLGV